MTKKKIKRVSREAATFKDIVTFKSESFFNKWLSRAHDKSAGIWLRIYKKGSGISTVSYQEALEVALCFGWIDGQKKSYDEKSWLQMFTPRRPKSIWSKRNTKIVEDLSKEKRIQPSGLKQVEAAKKDGRWAKAYDSPKDMKLPIEFLVEVKKDNRAYEFFLTLNKSNLYSIAWHLQTAKKEETKKRRMIAIIELLKKGKKMHQ